MSCFKNKWYHYYYSASAGPRHDVKDYWRFMDDAFEGIVEDSKYAIRVIEDYIDTFLKFKVR